MTMEKSIGVFIRQKRKENLLTADELAERIQVARSTIINIEKGRGALKFENAVKLSQALSFDLRELSFLWLSTRLSINSQIEKTRSLIFTQNNIPGLRCAN